MKKSKMPKVEMPQSAEMKCDYSKCCPASNIAELLYSQKFLGIILIALGVSFDIFMSDLHILTITILMVGGIIMIIKGEKKCPPKCSDSEMCCKK